jgi:hypothetical protein
MNSLNVYVPNLFSVTEISNKTLVIKEIYGKQPVVKYDINQNGQQDPGSDVPNVYYRFYDGEKKVNVLSN